MNGRQVHDDLLALAQFASPFSGNGPDGYCSRAHRDAMHQRWLANEALVQKHIEAICEGKYR